MTVQRAICLIFLGLLLALSAQVTSYLPTLIIAVGGLVLIGTTP